MTAKLTALEDVIAAFVAAHPGPGAKAANEWIKNWRECYPQFDEEIFEKGTDIVFGNLDALLGDPINPNQPQAPIPSMTDEEREEVMLNFLGEEDITPDYLADFKRRYPDMVDQLDRFARLASTAKYLEMPEVPLTPAELAREEREAMQMASEIMAGTFRHVPSNTLTKERTHLKSGPALRAEREAILSQHAGTKRNRRPERDAGR